MIPRPKPIRFVHQGFAPAKKEVIQAEKIVQAVRENADRGLGVFTVDGKMIGVAFLPGVGGPSLTATLPGVGLADVDIKDHIKSSFGYVWVFSILCMIVAIVLGIMPL